MNRMAVLGCIAIVLVTSAVYATGVFRNAFVEWDDGLLILNNPIIQGLNADNIKKAFTSYDPELYIPLTFLSYQLDYEIWGLNPVGVHLTNLLLHIGNAVLVMGLVFLLQKKHVTLSPTKGDTDVMVRRAHHDKILIISFLSSLLFVIHPLNTEAVMWASARKDVLMGFFFLLSLNFYLRSSDSKIAALRLLNRSYGIIAFILACLSKVTAVMLPFILLLIDWYEYSPPHRGRAAPKGTLPKGELFGLRVERGSIWNFMLNKIPYFVVSIIFIIIALFGKAGSHGLWWEKVLIGAKATIFYLQKLFWPTGLSVLYPYTEKISIANPDLLVPLILVLLLTILPLSLALFRGEREYKEWVFGWFFFLLLLLPSFTNFAKGQDLLKDVYFASDRYAYLASIGIIYFVGWLLCHSEHCRRATQGGFIFIIFLLSLFSYYQSFVWQTTESLFTNVVQYYQNSHVAQNNLGSLYYRGGEVDRAIEKYKESLAVRPNATAFFNLGVIYMDNGYPNIAKEAFTQALKLNPVDAEAKKKLSLLGM